LHNAIQYYYSFKLCADDDKSEMKEIQTIIKKYDELKASGKRLAMATVIHVEHSSYRRSGARMLISEDGLWTGGISGGCLEGDTLQKAKQAMLENRVIKVTYDTTDGDSNQIGIGLGCNGLIDVLIVPIDTQDPGNQIETLRKCTAQRNINTLITVVKSGDQDELQGKLIYATDETAFAEYFKNDVLKEQVKLDVKKVKFTKRSTSFEYAVDGQDWKIFVEHLLPPVALYICGQNYDTIPLAQMAKHIGWTVTVVSNPIKIGKELHHVADQILNQKKEFPGMDFHSAVLLMAHDYNTDKENLTQALGSLAPYIGILGPKKRSGKMIAELAAAGIKLDDQRVFAPVGLDTGATSPEEIAVSILAEIRTFYSKRSGGFLKKRQLPINDT